MWLKVEAWQRPGLKRHLLVKAQALLAFWLQTYYLVGGKLFRMLRRRVFCSAKARVLHRIMKTANSYEEWKVTPRPGESNPQGVAVGAQHTLMTVVQWQT